MKKKGKKGENDRCQTPTEHPRKESHGPMDLLMKLTHKKMSSGSAVIPSNSESSSPSYEKHNTIESDHLDLQESQEEWYEELSDDHTSAFKEVFDMLDSAHTGMLNADNLYEGLRRVDSEITKEEVQDVLKTLDKDGNGVIDFDEFLMHITQQGSDDGGNSGDSKPKGYTKRQRLFISALKKFNIMSELCKPQKVHQPHVLRHYTAGVRLIGLTDKQIAIKLKKMQKAGKNINSPYAKPLTFVIPSGSTNQIQTLRTTIGLKTSNALPDSENKRKQPPSLLLSGLKCGRSQADMEKEIQSFVSGTFKLNARLRSLKLPHAVDILALEKPDGEKSELNAQVPENIKPRKKGTGFRSRGWVMPRTERDKVPLPVLKLSGKRYGLTIEDLPDIREKVKLAVDQYYARLRNAFVQNAYDHWEKLYAHHIRSKRLLNIFRELYRAYSPHKEVEACVVCPWVPGPFRPVHHSRIHSTAVRRERVTSPDLKHGARRPVSCMY
ncbi:uncharacterized protein LOC126819602 [Patella vulgata]|uniref:uncharacterized protein LOC126819602 n=1 Tax=Patella vulgata TaxID=6465 RepID=UPI0021802EDF|nr:uncharacterized protein LOC126819602 [Patella vulgata]